MAIAPFKIIDRRRIYGGGANLGYEAASQTTQRRPIPRTDIDYDRSLTTAGWRELLSGARFLWNNFGPIRGGIRQMATYAVGQSFNVQYLGRNKSWGARMEEAVWEYDKICEIRGHPFTFRTALVLDLVSLIRDGDCSTLLTETTNGWPLFQSLPAHRIGRIFNPIGAVAEGPYAGRRLCYGVIQDDYARPLAYRVYVSDHASAEFADIPSDALLQTYRPDYTDQVRGLSWLAPAINDVADIFDIRSFVKLAIKGEASITLIEHNEAGRPLDAGHTLLSGGPTEAAPTNPHVERLDGGGIRYFRAGTNSKIDAPNTNRPGANSQQFTFEILRGAFEALGWPIEFYDPSALGGANIRLRVAQARRTIEALQEIAESIARRKHLYMIAKLIKAGALDPDPDWWQIEHQKPRSITVDNGHDTKADLDLYLKGIITLQELCARMGNYWEEVQDQKIAEEQRLQERCAAAGVDPNRVAMLNPNPPSPPATPDDEREEPA